MFLTDKASILKSPALFTVNLKIFVDVLLMVENELWHVKFSSNDEFILS
jgi:hypothetical protein